MLAFNIFAQRIRMLAWISVKCLGIRGSIWRWWVYPLVVTFNPNRSLDSELISLDCWADGWLWVRRRSGLRRENEGWNPTRNKMPTREWKMTGSYLLYNELHYNGLMTDLGLIPSLYHLEEHSLQEHTLLHLCVIVSNLAEMFFVVTLAKRLYSLLFLPSFLLLLSSRTRARTTGVLFFCCHKCHSRWSWQHFLIPKNNVLFYWKQRIVLLKTTCRFIENNVSFCAG